MQTETIITDASNTALDFFERFTYGYASEYTLQSRYGYALVFTPGAVARFASIAGWVTGLKHGGKGNLAASLASDLDERLQQLAAYGRRDEFEVLAEGGQSVVGRVTVPRMKVVLGDDGTFGGFTIAWYSAITSGAVAKRARETSPDAYNSSDEWCTALDTTRERLRLRRDLDELRYYKPGWAKEDDYRVSELVYYAYAFNGGLLYHGPGGGEVFAVTVDRVRGWSVHT